MPWLVLPRVCKIPVPVKNHASGEEGLLGRWALKNIKSGAEEQFVPLCSQGVFSHRHR